MRRESRERVPHHRLQEKTANKRSRHASRHLRDVRAVMHVWIAKHAVTGKTFPAFPVHAQTTILSIWLELHTGGSYVIDPLL